VRVSNGGHPPGQESRWCPGCGRRQVHMGIDQSRDYPLPGNVDLASSVGEMILSA
jgi:hypothetical protein